MAYPRHPNQPPPHGQSYNAPRERRPPPPQQTYNDGYQQDWGTDGYGYDNTHNDYEQNHGANGYAYDEGAYDQGAGYDQGYYGPEGYQEPPRHPQPRRGPPPPGWDSRGRGPPPPNMRGPPRDQLVQKGLPPRGASRDPYSQGPPPPQSRARSKSRTRQRDDRYYDRGPPPPNMQSGWGDPYGRPSNGPSSRQSPPGPMHSQPGPYPPPPQSGRGRGYGPPGPPRQPRDGQYQEGQYGADPRRPPPQQQIDYPDQRQQPPMPAQDPHGRNRAPMPHFTSVKHHPREQRPGTSNGTRDPPPREAAPPQPHTAPVTPVNGAFPNSFPPMPPQSQQRPPENNYASPPPPPPKTNFSLPTRQRPEPAARAPAPSEEMPRFDASVQSNGTYERPAYEPSPPQPAQQIEPVRTTVPQAEERFEMPGDTPGFPLANSPPMDDHPQTIHPFPPSQTNVPEVHHAPWQNGQAQLDRPQQGQYQAEQRPFQNRNQLPPRRQMTDGSYQAAPPQFPHQEQPPPPPQRQMTDGLQNPHMNQSPPPFQNDSQPPPRRQTTDEPQPPANQFYGGPVPRPSMDRGPPSERVQDAYAPQFPDPPPPLRQDSSFSEPGRPRTPGGSRPNTAGVERPNYYPAMNALGAASPGRNPAADDRSRSQEAFQPPRGAPNVMPQHAMPPPSHNAERSRLLPKQDLAPARSNSDALPHHPSPIRPVARTGTSGEERPKPAPVRQYPSESAPRDAAGSRKPSQVKAPPVTQAELNSLRSDVARVPTDYKTQLLLAKKLVEASHILADEGGRADQRTRLSNQERYIKEGRKIVQKLASNHYPEAMFYLADCYGEGSLGLANDPKEAFTLYQAAAKMNHAPSAYRTAVCCEIGAEEGGGTRRDFQKAVQWYSRAASLGDIPAAYKMGIIKLKGLLNQEKNLPEAVTYLKKAAEHADEENPHALHELATIYESPTSSMKRDEAEAFRLFTAASKLGYKFSQLKLGQAYEYGQLGAPVDSRSSIIWYTKAAAQGEHQSELALSGWYLTGAEGILEHSDTEAYLWARKAAAAEPPLPKAMFAMGYFTETGIGCPRSLDEAKRWYGRAAAHNFPKARERLDELRRGGTKAQKNRENLNRKDQKKNDENCIIM